MGLSSWLTNSLVHGDWPHEQIDHLSDTMSSLVSIHSHSCAPQRRSTAALGYLAKQPDDCEGITWSDQQ